ncbi:hypothetical protein D3C71_1997650 [compost metagenome]
MRAKAKGHDHRIRRYDMFGTLNGYRLPPALAVWSPHFGSPHLNAADLTFLIDHDA